jgi:hypothetical protein
VLISGGMKNGGYNDLLSWILAGHVITVLVAGRLDVYTRDWDP